MSQPSGRRSIARSPLFIALAVSAVLASVVGNVQAIWGTQPTPWADLSLSLYGSVKLFLFETALEDQTTGPALYEIARWIAPLTTAGSLLAVFEAMAVNVRMRLHPVRGGHVVVLGCGERSRAVIHQVLGWEGASAVVCVVPDTTPYDEIQSLKLSGVHVVALDYDNVETESDLRAVRRIRLDTALGVICLETEPESFGHVRWIAAHTPRDVKVTVHLNSESRRLREIFEQVIRRYPNFDIHYFDLSELASHLLLNSGEFTILPPELEQSRRFVAGQASSLRGAGGRPRPVAGPLGFEEIAAALPEPHVLLVGVGEVGSELLGMLANLGVTSPLDPLRVTVVDKAASSQVEQLFSQVEDVGKVLRLETVDASPESRLVRERLQEIAAAHPFSAAVYALGNPRESLLSADFHMPVLGSIPVAVWCQHRADVEPILQAMPGGRSLRLFGLDTEVLNPEAILSDRYLDQARHFNFIYAQTTAEVQRTAPPASAEASWRDLSTVKRESSFALAMHRETKSAVLDRIARVFTGIDGLELANLWEARLEGLDPEAQVKVIESDPLLNYMTALEHRRWSTFYYLRGFVYGPRKDEVQRTHDCLVDSWPEFLNGPKRETAIYDAFASLVIDGKLFDDDADEAPRPGDRGALWPARPAQ
ncbi:MAG: hypothetical protein ACFNKK_02730 [Peptidiphaga sp.]|jgi:hypothetical protein|uniref:hypothetical protein n=1 Tax=Actinobaculum sp. oral taxon 183 TaxID=712888 RepID=UPI00039838EB|nr:hypothetical protein [Actinobaculum sp. oral taxon 183]ERH16705.1 hypothetical protein HMPREF0043_01780 [Actinobaculum sp. oral taxon 183 str. F0552]RKV68664.1 MAG: hypothetical protein D8B44_02870 [Actinomyces sp.]